MADDALPSDAGAPGARGDDQVSSSAVRRRGEGVRPFRLPVGVEMIEGENYRHREAYDVVYLKDDETPRYRYTVGVSADRIADLFRGLAGLLPEQVCVILEIPAPEGGGPEACDVWVSPPVGLAEALAEFRAHERVFVHDGMVGFGLVAPDGPDNGRATTLGPPGPPPADADEVAGIGHGPCAPGSEVFIDEHKLVFLYTREMDGADAVLSGLGVRPVDLVRHFSELGHVHASLAGKGAGEPYWEVARGLRDRLGLEWEESRKYT